MILHMKLCDNNETAIIFKSGFYTYNSMTEEKQREIFYALR